MLENVKGLSSMATGFLNGSCLNRTVTEFNSNRSMMRPDLMVINTTNRTSATLDACKKRGQYGRRRGMLSAGHPEHPVKVMIVEVGYIVALKSMYPPCRQTLKRPGRAGLLARGRPTHAPYKPSLQDTNGVLEAWNLLLWAHGPRARTASQGLVLWWSSLWCHFYADRRSFFIFQNFSFK